MPDANFDSHYNDPLGDIVFRSRTGTHFRMSSWYLARHRCTLHFSDTGAVLMMQHIFRGPL